MDLTEKKVYNISSVIEFYALCDFGEEKDIYWDTYLALCKAYGMPPDWEKLHEDGVTENNSSIYEGYRRAFQEPLAQFHYEVCYGERRPLGVKMFQLRTEIFVLLKDKLLEMDKLFFKEVFGRDTEKSFTEEEMVNTFGMPTTEARREWFAENF
ncbi:MAG: hypothetical protein HY786_06385 [Deltaproteobacteria bacterium]|nr:hypothetical protein [Deltaproteobacteria bacterium]